MNTQTCLSDTDMGRLWEGDTSPQERRDFQSHLETCADCNARWKRVAEGGQYLAGLYEAAAGVSVGSCLSDEQMAAYVDNALNAADKQQAEQHLAQCEQCSEAVRVIQELSETGEQEAEQWWSQHTGRQVLQLFVHVPEAAEQLTEAISPARPFVAPSEQTVATTILEPTQAATRRLAAATGEGFSEQVIRQQSPPFELHLVRFGQELQIDVRALEADSPYRECLARLELLEDDICKLSRVVVVEDGQARCRLSPQETAACRPDEQTMTVRLVPMVTVQQLDEAGMEAYVPILTKLLDHKEPQIRCHAAQVLARVCGSAAQTHIEPLLHDQDEAVRSTVRKWLEFWTGKDVTMT